MFELTQNSDSILNTAPAEQIRCVISTKKDVLTGNDPLFPFPFFNSAVLPENKVYAGSYDGVPCFACIVPDLTPYSTPDTKTVPVRSVLAEYGKDAHLALCRGRELADWISGHRFCGKCGSVLQPSKSDMAMICPACKGRYYPQIAPAVITAILRNHGTEILLAHNRNFEDGVYSLIAGFVEMGESAEDAVHREILEETAIHVKNLHYLSSQPWPYPNSLMLAFQAEYEDGEVVPDGTELTDLAWFPLTALPKLPHPGSIARKVLDGLSRKKLI